MLQRMMLLVVCALVPFSALACLNTKETERDYDRMADGRTVPSPQFFIHGGKTLVDGSEKTVSHSNQIYNLLPNEKEPDGDGLQMLRYGWGVVEDVKTEGARELAKLEGASSFSERNDKAVALIKVGRLEEAVALLVQLEAERPGDYSVAANLGTAYELMGKDELALEWIRKGIERNPESHQGSEWLHVRILETKIGMKKDPDWLKGHSVAGLDFGDGELPSRPSPSSLPLGNDGKPLSFLRAHAGIGYQLSERLRFVKPADPVVADLLMDYGQGAFLLEGARWSKELLEASRLYGVERAEFKNRQRAIFRWSVENPPEPRRYFLGPSVAGLVATLLLTAAWVGYNLRLRRRGLWGLRQSGVWMLLAAFHLFAILFSWGMAALASFSFEWNGTVFIAMATIIVGLLGHVYGLVIARGKMGLLGLLLWPLGLSMGLAGLEFMVFIVLSACVVRIVQGLRSPVWLTKPPVAPEQDQSNLTASSKEHHG